MLVSEILFWRIRRSVYFNISISVKEKLQSVYDTIAERIILMALESVDYCEDKAIQILNIVVADNQKEAAVDDEKTDVGEPQNTDAKGWVWSMGAMIIKYHRLLRH